MFGNYFKHILALTLLAGISYSLPQVKAEMVNAFSISSNNVAAAVTSISQPILVKEIKGKVIYDSSKKESSINITAKVQITAMDSDIDIADNSFYFNLKNKTLDTVMPATVQSSKVISNLSQGKGGFYIIKKGTTALFNVTASINPAYLIAGQYQANLYLITSNVKLYPPTNKSNTFIVVGENSPYITLVGKGIYGTKDSVTLNSVRAGKNPTITIVKESDTNTPFKIFSAKGINNSNQIKFNLENQNIPFGNYYIYLTNTQLGDQAGKSNYVRIQVLDQSKLITAEVTAGKLGLSYDANQRESSLSALFEIKVKAVDKDIVFNSSPFQFIVTDSNGYQMNFDSYEVKGINSQNPVFPYTLKAGKEARFIVNSFTTPRLMFAGNYSMSLVGIYGQTAVTSGNVPQMVAIQVPENKTNSVVIIGEVSPYINSISPNPASAGKILTLTGARLNGVNLFIDNINLGMFVGLNDSSLSFYVPASTTDGYHILQVKSDSAGASNIIWFKLEGGTSVVNIPYISNVVGPAQIIDKSFVGLWTLYIQNPDNISATVSVDWNDSSLVETVGWTSSVAFSHQYKSDGKYSIKFSINYNDGRLISSQYQNVSVGPIIEPPISPCYTFTSNLTIGNTGADVVALQNYLIKNGFAINSGDETVTGYFGALTKAAVMLYQTSIGQPATGFVGPLTRATLNACRPTIPPIEVNTPPIINGITAPTSLKIGETGTWSISASDPENKSISYSVDWGDNNPCSHPNICEMKVQKSITQTSTFSHSYSTAGSYKITFTVRDDVGQSAQSTATVEVGRGISYPPVVIQSPIYINAGGSASGDYLADKYFTGGKTYSITNKIDTSAVSNPAPQSVYQTERYGEATVYSIPDLTPGSKYSVALDFSENYVNGPNQRVFNVSLNDNQVITNFDIFKEAGAKYKAVQKSFTAVADSLGKITITFKSLKNAAKIDGISVMPVILESGMKVEVNSIQSDKDIKLGAAIWNAVTDVFSF